MTKSTTKSNQSKCTKYNSYFSITTASLVIQSIGTNSMPLKNDSSAICRRKKTASYSNRSLWMNQSMAFETVEIVWSDALWWNWYGWLIHISSEKLIPSFFHSRDASTQNNKQAWLLCVCMCKALRPFTMNVEEHVSTCCGAASFHYMGARQCISPYPSIQSTRNAPRLCPCLCLLATQTAAYCDCAVYVIAQVCVFNYFTWNCAWYLCGTVRRVRALRQCDSSISIQFENGRQC